MIMSVLATESWDDVENIKTRNAWHLDWAREHMTWDSCDSWVGLKLRNWNETPQLTFWKNKIRLEEIPLKRGKSRHFTSGVAANFWGPFSVGNP